MVPNDIELVQLAWSLREKIDLVNSSRDMMIQRRFLPLSNAQDENKANNDQIAAIVPDIKICTNAIRDHLAKGYPRIRERLSVVH